MADVTATVRAPRSAVPPPPLPVARRWRLDRPLAVPTLVAALNALVFLVVRPDVGDLQAALARESAARNGVGLTYWYGWFGGGATPGNYSVITPTLSAWFGAVAVGMVATVVLTPLAWLALEGTAHHGAGTWVATAVAALNLWSGRIPFALGLVFAVVAVLGVRARWTWLALGATVLSSLCSPVTGAFVAFALAAAFLVDRQVRRLAVGICAVCGLTLVVVAAVFGTPGPQDYSVYSGLLTAASALAMLYARPHPTVRVVLWCTALAAPILTFFPNGMGSNFVRFPWICVPAAVVATAAAAPRWRVVVALLPALALCANSTITDLVRADQPSASRSYYDSLITQLRGLPDRHNYRLEVVGDPHIHTAAYALLGHIALAGGYETQEQNALNHILNDPAHLNPTSYQVWLNNSAVGYVALDRARTQDYAEYTLVSTTRLPYLTEISRSRRWVLYKVRDATPIVPPPQRLLSAGQAQMRIEVPCACRFYVRVRYSKFLGATAHFRDTGGAHVTTTARLADDGNGWTVVTTYVAGVYVFDGNVTRRLGSR